MALKLERLGALYEDRAERSGQGAGALRRMGGAGDASPGGAAGAAARGREGGRRAGRRRGGAEAGDRDRATCRRRPASRGATAPATIYEERAAADDEAVRAYEAALALDAGVAPGAGGAGARPLSRRPARGAGGGAVAAGGLRVQSGGRQRVEVEAARDLGVPAGARRRGAGGGDPGARLRPFERRRDRGARAPARAHRPRPGAGRGAGRRWGRRRRIRRTRRPRTACRPRCVEWQLGSRREALVAIERAIAAIAAGRGTSRSPGAAAIDIAHERLFQLVGRGAEVAAAQVGELGNGRRPERHRAAAGSRLAAGGAGSGMARAAHGRWTSRRATARCWTRR